MRKYEDMKIGDEASVKHTITEKDIEQFVDLTGDDNKLHVNKDFARTTEYKHPVVHGMLGASFISTVIGTKLPGDGALWYSQTLEFIRPVRVGDTIIVTGKIISKNDKNRTLEIKTDIQNQYRQTVTTGVAKVKLVEQLPELEKEKDSKKVKKVVILLGATGGIGRATAFKLAHEGYDLLIHYNTNKELADSIRKKLKSTGRKIVAQQADLLDDESINVFIERVKREFSSVYALVNCSTVKVPNIKFSNLDWNYMQEHFDINIKSSFLILKEILPIMERQKIGKVVFLTSQAIESPNAEWLHYITSKSALHGFAKALAIEYAPKGININLVSPSMTDTDLLAEIPRKVKLLNEAKTPLKRLCKPVDVANAIAFLLSENADFITGETIRVNGGQVML